MSISYAMLLDGGFIRHKLSTSSNPVNAAAIRDFTSAVGRLPCLAGMRLHRICFYDSRPLQGTETKPLGGGLMDFGATLGHGVRDGLREHADLVVDQFPLE